MSTTTSCPVGRALVANAVNLYPLLVYPVWAKAILRAQTDLRNSIRV